MSSQRCFLEQYCWYISLISPREGSWGASGDQGAWDDGCSMLRPSFCDADARASTAAATATRAGGDAQGQARTPGPRWAAASRPGASVHPPSSFRRGYIPAPRGPRVAARRLGAGLASGTPGTPTGPARPEQSAGSRGGARECRLHGR